MKSITKRTLSAALTIIMLFCLLPTAAFADTVFTLRVNPYGGAENDIDTITWYKSVVGQYYLFLPADCDLSKLTVYLDGAEKITVDASVVNNAEETKAFSRCGEHIVMANGKPYSVYVMQSENIPAVYIETESGSLDYIHASKDNKEKAVIRTYENGEMTLDSPLNQIKGRGNSTWNYPKKPYNIKFKDKTSLLGMDKAKKWTMIASYIEPSLVRNPLSWELSDLMGLKFASDYRFADVYINGEYTGNYIICESVEIGESRINITDLTKATEKVNKGTELEDFPRGSSGEENIIGGVTAFPSEKWVNIPNDPKNITGGYLLECEYTTRYDEEISGFVTKRGLPMVIKEPECASQKQVEYISSYWQEAEDAICSPDGCNSLNKHYSEYFDVDSLVNMYILLELSGNRDAGISSTYFYKDADGKLVASPIWDSDTAFGNIGVIKKTGTVQGDPSMWIVNRANYNSVTDVATDDEYPTIYNMLYRLAEFRELVSARWAELSDVLNAKNIISIINELADTIRASAIMNGVRWIQVFDENIYASVVGMVNRYINERVSYLNKGFGKNAAQVYYDPNGGIGWTAENRIIQNGYAIVVNGPYCAYTKDILDVANISMPAIQPPEEGLRFAGWNTKADGSGKTFQPGEILIANGVVTLYAQWEQQNENVLYKYSWLFSNPVLEFFRSLANVIRTMFFTWA